MRVLYPYVPVRLQVNSADVVFVLVTILVPDVC